MTQSQINHMKRAAANRSSWGRFAARQYAIKHGVPLWAYRLACQLQSVEG